MQEIKLDKTADGNYWTLEGWLDDDWAMRLRITHTTYCEPSEVQAEIGVWSEAEQLIIWKTLGSPFMFALGSPDFVAEAEWADEFPNECKEAFVELGRVLGRISRHLDLGPALGGLRCYDAEG